MDAIGLNISSFERIRPAYIQPVVPPPRPADMPAPSVCYDDVITISGSSFSPSPGIEPVVAPPRPADMPDPALVCNQDEPLQSGLSFETNLGTTVYSQCLNGPLLEF